MISCVHNAFNRSAAPHQTDKHCIDIVDSLLKGLPHFLGLGPLYFISGVLYFIGLTAAAITRNERYHQFYAIFFLLQTVIISFVIFHTLV
jgi:hypothetical protein